ncbi:hypothetical protein PP175_24010 [Aneurinibacillus sp. Ricciae_BoGa-3]|nr:hypothetical protein [Aneurinibacillus sp. Ricciae_BoGa-3]WCK54311.1 hypothetical protein PP175_24010 [Aneurinibacillus sp. Ricciae_BoGa-3]
MTLPMVSAMKAGQKWNNGSCREILSLPEQVTTEPPQGSPSL